MLCCDQCLSNRNLNVTDLVRRKRNERDSCGSLVGQRSVRGQNHWAGGKGSPGGNCSEQTKSDNADGQSNTNARHEYLLSLPTPAHSSSALIPTRSKSYEVASLLKPSLNPA